MSALILKDGILLDNDVAQKVLICYFKNNAFHLQKLTDTFLLPVSSNIPCQVK